MEETGSTPAAPPLVVRPCPCHWCGSTMVAHGMFDGSYMAITCMNCGAHGPITKTPVPTPCLDVHPWINEAIEGWNRRSPLSPSDGIIDEIASALEPFSRPGGGGDMQAFHDLEDDVVVWSNSGAAVTAGDVRTARRALAKVRGIPVSEMHRRAQDLAAISRAADELRTAATLAEGAPTPDIKALVDRFLAWPLPKSVRSDLCVTMDYAFPRSGTNLLGADEARQMLEYLFAAPQGAASSEAGRVQIGDPLPVTSILAPALGGINSDKFDGKFFGAQDGAPPAAPGIMLKHDENCAVNDTDLDVEGICSCGAYDRRREAIQKSGAVGGWLELPSALMKDEKLWATGKHFVWLPDGTYRAGKLVTETGTIEVERARCAALICFGCAHGWERVEVRIDGFNVTHTMHRAPDSATPGHSCTAAPIWRSAPPQTSGEKE